MKTHLVGSFLCLLLAAAVVSCQRPKTDPKDFSSYIEEIRQTGMSEGAQNELRMVANIRCGAMTLGFAKDSASGTYGRSYGSTLCARPNADPAAFKKLQEEMQANTEREVHLLQPLADADSSGFVSSAEAAEFRTLVEFGYQAAFILEQEHHDLPYTCKGMMISSSEFSENLAKYRVLEARAKQAGIQPLPIVAL